jgi:hypothetical protein
VTQVEPKIEPYAEVIIRNFRRVASGASFANLSKHEKSFVDGLLDKINYEALAAIEILETKYSNMAYPSILVLARSILEACALVKFIFLDPYSHSQTTYNLLVYELNGLLIRQKFRIRNITDKSKAQMDVEKLRIEEIISRIEKNEMYLSKTPRQQNETRNGKSKLINKTDTPKVLGFGEQMISVTYPFLSDYSHSGYIAVLQTHPPDITGRMNRASLNYVAESLALLIKSMNDTDSAVDNKIKSIEGFKDAMDMYVELSQN